MKDDERYRDMIKEIDERGMGLTDWELEFIADMIDKDIKSFSVRQAAIIERIYEERM